MVARPTLIEPLTLPAFFFSFWPCHLNQTFFFLPYQKDFFFFINDSYSKHFYFSCWLLLQTFVLLPWQKFQTVNLSQNLEYGSAKLNVKRKYKQFVILADYHKDQSNSHQIFNFILEEVYFHSSGDFLTKNDA